MAVVIETTLGDITVDLYLEQRPVTCLNFLKLCKMKYYNFNLFHTIRSGFIAQTGDPTGEGSGGESIFGLLEGPNKRFFSGEKMPKIRHTDTGLLSMVGTGEMMVGSQFFFTLGSDLDSLDGVHCVIGEVSEGHEVLRKLNEVICDETHRPYQDVRITHTVVLEDPFSDPAGLRAPSRSPSPSAERLKGGRIAPDEEIDETQGRTADEVQEIIEEKEAKARATILEIVGDIPDADIAPPENVLFVCKLNPVTTDEDLEIIFSRFGKIVSCEVIRDKKSGDSLQYAFIEFDDKKACEDAYFKMDNVLIDDRRIHVDFSQSVSKIKWLGKGRGVRHMNEDNDSKGNHFISSREGIQRPKNRDRHDSGDHMSRDRDRYNNRNSHTKNRYESERIHDRKERHEKESSERKRRDRSTSRSRSRREHSKDRSARNEQYDKSRSERNSEHLSNERSRDNDHNHRSKNSYRHTNDRPSSPNSQVNLKDKEKYLSNTQKHKSQAPSKHNDSGDSPVPISKQESATKKKESRKDRDEYNSDKDKRHGKDQTRSSMKTDKHSSKENGNPSKKRKLEQDSKSSKSKKEKQEKIPSPTTPPHSKKEKKTDLKEKSNKDSKKQVAKVKRSTKNKNRPVSTSSSDSESSSPSTTSTSSSESDSSSSSDSHTKKKVVNSKKRVRSSSSSSSSTESSSTSSSSSSSSSSESTSSSSDSDNTKAKKRKKTVVSKKTVSKTKKK